MRVIVFGGRDYANQLVAWAALDELHRRWRIDQLVHGDAYGADRLGARWAINHHVPVKPYPAAWDDIDVIGAVVKLNKAGLPYNALAGHWRNQRMVDLGCDVALQFPGNTGTADMRRRLNSSGIRVIEVYDEPHAAHEESWLKALFIRTGIKAGFKLTPVGETTDAQGQISSVFKIRKADTKGA